MKPEQDQTEAKPAAENIPQSSSISRRDLVAAGAVGAAIAAHAAVTAVTGARRKGGEQ